MKTIAGKTKCYKNFSDRFRFLSPSRCCLFFIGQRDTEKKLEVAVCLSKNASKQTNKKANNGTSDKSNNFSKIELIFVFVLIKRIVIKEKELKLGEVSKLIFISSQHLALRHKRQHGANLYLPESYIIPGGEGDDSEWGDWGTPSECSRTCGGGVAHQTRECLNIGRDGEPNCQGGSKKYFSCNTQDCPENDVDFRQQQCSQFDRTPFEGVYYNWVPYTKAPNPCELNCMPRGERFYYRHRSKVTDGTRCNDQSVDVCVDGQCQVTTPQANHMCLAHLSFPHLFT
jgi:hypothetical protein